MSPPPMPPRPSSPVAGAVNGMPGPGNPLAAEFQQVVQRTQALIGHLKQIPGIDQQKLGQGVAMLGQAMQAIASALKPGGPPGAAPGGPPGAPPGGPPPEAPPE